MVLRSLAISGLLVGCAADLAFHCESSAQCTTESQQGVCQPTGFCSHFDSGCPEGSRYVEHASAELAGQCVEYGALLGWWPFDDGVGGTARDASGNGNDGMFMYGPLWGEGVRGGGVECDGVDDMIEADGISRFGTSSWSAFAWVRSDDRSSVQARVFGFWFDPGYFYLNFGNGRPATEGVDDLGNHWSVSANTGTDVADNAWHHLGVVIDRERKELRLYIDGAFEARTLIASPGQLGPDPVGPGAHGFRLCAQNRTDTLTLRGSIDEPRVYARVLEDNEVYSLYEADAPR